MDINIPYVTTSTLEFTSNMQDLIKGVFTFVVAISPIFLRLRMLEKAKHFFIYLYEDKGFIRKFLLNKIERSRKLLLFLKDLFLANLLRLRLYFKVKRIRKKLNDFTYTFTKDMLANKETKTENFNLIFLEKKKFRSKLEKLGYFKKEVILNSFNLSNRKRKQIFSSYKESLLERYYLKQKERRTRIKG